MNLIDKLNALEAGVQEKHPRLYSLTGVALIALCVALTMLYAYAFGG